MPLPVYIRAAANQQHPEAVDWATRVIANGGTVTTPIMRAVSNFCYAIDRGGLRSSMYRVNLFCGGNLSGCLVPLYRSTSFLGTNLGNATDTNFNFVSADFSETGATGGLKGNGSNKYLVTGLNSSGGGFANAIISINSIHMGASGSQMETGSSGANTLMGGQESNSPFRGVVLWSQYSFVSPTQRRFEVNGQNASASSFYTPITTTSAHVIGTLTGTQSILTENGLQVALTNYTTAPGEFSSLGNSPIWIFARGAVGQFATSARIKGYHCGTGITLEQSKSVADAFIAFNAALNR